MSTPDLRAQMQAAAIAVDHGLLSYWEIKVQAANAAYEVAEPLLRDLYEMLRDSTPGPWGDDWPIAILCRRAKEALDADT